MSIVSYRVRLVNEMKIIIIKAITTDIDDGDAVQLNNTLAVDIRVRRISLCPRVIVFHLRIRANCARSGDEYIIHPPSINDHRLRLPTTSVVHRIAIETRDLAIF